MFPFAFEQITLDDSNNKIDQITLLQSYLMIILENERLNKHIMYEQHNQQATFSLDKKYEFNHEHQYKLEIELKQVKIDNLTNIIKQLQIQINNGDHQYQQIIHKNSQIQLSLKQQITQLRSNLNYYHKKIQQEQSISKKYSKIQGDYKLLKNQLELKTKQYNIKINQLKTQNNKIQNYYQSQTLENQKRIKQLRNIIDNLRNDLSIKQQQCFSLKTSLNDCPKMQELNRWINKVKQYEQRQVQACAKMSQMSQQLCISRQKCRKTQYEYKQLQKIKQQLETALTENKGHQDSMVIYFDRLQTYQKVIKDLQQQIKKLEFDNKNKQKQSQIKLEQLSKQKDALISQWRSITQEMQKQKTLLISTHKEIQKYQQIINEQNQKQNDMIKLQQINRTKMQMKIIQQQQRNSKQIDYQPYSFIDSSKCTQKSNRSLSLQDKTRQIRNYNLQTQPQSHVTQNCSSRQLRASSSIIGRISSEQRLIHYSDPHSRNSTSRLNTQSSHQSSKQIGCGECMSRVQQRRNDCLNHSVGLQNKVLRNEEYRGQIVQITDQKKLLMQKLNILKPQDPNASIRSTDRSISNLYSKNYRQVNPTQTILKLNPSNNSKQLGAYQLNNHNKLQLGRGRIEQKQNLNDMIVKRYSNLMKQQ